MVATIAKILHCWGARPIAIVFANYSKITGL